MGLVLEHDLQNPTPVQVLAQHSNTQANSLGNLFFIILVLSPQKRLYHFIPIKAKSNLRLISGKL